VFQSFDDITPLAAGPHQPGAPTFQHAWNHERYRTARALFSDGRSDTPEQRALPCYECPTAILWERWVAHRQAGGKPASFDPGMEVSANGAWNYVWERGQQSRP
jgi:hypothetical protein